MAMWYGIVQCLTLRFCHFFQETFPGQQMKNISLHSGSGTRWEARLIPMTWLVPLLPTLMSRWVRRRSRAFSSGFRPWAMLGSRSRRSWPGGEARGRGGDNNSIGRTSIRSRSSRTLCFCLLLVFSYCGIYWLVSCKLSWHCFLVFRWHISMAFVRFSIIFSISILLVIFAYWLHDLALKQCAYNV